MADDQRDSQADVIAFLTTPSSYPHRPETIERIDTHGAVIFLAGDRAYKLKRAVKLAYLDFSTLEKRRIVCERELELNRRTAPELYLGVLPITRDADGKLGFGGVGEIVEWVIEMRRFDSDKLFDRLAEAGRLDAALIEDLAKTIECFHADAPIVTDCVWPESLVRVAGTVMDAFRHPELAASGLGPAIAGLRSAMDNHAALLSARREAGLVRRCHGDLHLKNIVLFNGEPRLFDALEFDENLATIDVLYDLAFLLMDLWHRGLRAEANLILNHYFARDASEIEWTGLALLPLFLSLRAGVRAMVGLDGLSFASGATRERLREDIKAYAGLAQSLITPPPPRLILIGGLSGTGKTTIARAIAPRIAPIPGAIHLRSDLERKRLFGAAPTEHLGGESYTLLANREVYQRLASKAEAVLRAGHSVIADATFLRSEDRDLFTALADRLGTQLEGVWLEADEAQMTARVTVRRRDASDADAAVVRRQISQTPERPPDWIAVDARGNVEATTEAVAARLRL
jgi:aminoglycoside phosphotransferase family enzyme/predicted kinase